MSRRRRRPRRRSSRSCRSRTSALQRVACSSTHTLRCADGSYYIGSTNDVSQRLQFSPSGRGTSAQGRQAVQPQRLPHSVRSLHIAVVGIRRATIDRAPGMSGVKAVTRRRASWCRIALSFVLWCSGLSVPQSSLPCSASSSSGAAFPNTWSTSGYSTLRIGRGASNELLLRDPDKTVSRTHARIVRSGDGWTFIDQDSLNGSWMSGELVERVRLAPGMTITLGDYELRCEARDLRRARPEEQTRIAGIPGLAHARRRVPPGTRHGDEGHGGHRRRQASRGAFRRRGRCIDRGHRRRRASRRWVRAHRDGAVGGAGRGSVQRVADRGFPGARFKSVPLDTGSRAATASMAGGASRHGTETRPIARYGTKEVRHAAGWRALVDFVASTPTVRSRRPSSPPQRPPGGLSRP